jgi:hypothetical protein
MPGALREGQHGPVTPPKDGQPPGWIVMCLDCGFSVDAHGASAPDAIQSVGPRHERTHKLIATAADYAAHPRYR